MSIGECQGQSQAVSQLQRARRSGRVAHGYIFHGPSGVGKHLLAVQWAKLILCDNPVQRLITSPDDPANLHFIPLDIEDCCDQCRQCLLADAGTHPDLHRIYKELIRFTPNGRDRQPINLPIDVIREFVIKPAGRQPQHGRARVFIIDQADMMTTEAQNALLKTLEEPPGHTFIILVCSHRDRLLPTIRSRCQSIRFHPLPGEFVRRRLMDTGLPEPQADYWTYFCQGRLGDALRFGRSEVYSIKCELIERLSRLAYPDALELAEWVVDQAKLCADKTDQQDNKPFQPEDQSPPEPRNPRGESSSSDDQPQDKKSSRKAPAGAVRQGYLLLLRMAGQAFGAAMRNTADAGPAHGGGWDQPMAMNTLSARFGTRGCAEAIQATHRAAGLINANINPTLIFESLLLKYLDYALRPATRGAV